MAWKTHHWSTPPHFQRFLTESAALAITIEAAESYGWDPFAGHDLFWIDDLIKTNIPSLAKFVPNGPRPDILFKTPNGWRGLESRGRSGAAPKRGVNKAQRSRLTQLNAWASAVGTARGSAAPAWGMVWSWFDLDGTEVDFFDPGEPVEMTKLELGALDELRLETEAAFISALTNSPSAFLVRDSAIVAEVRPVSLLNGGRSLTYVAIGAIPDTLRATATSDAQEQEAAIGPVDLIQYGRLLFFAGTIDNDSSVPITEAVSQQLSHHFEF